MLSRIRLGSGRPVKMRLSRLSELYRREGQTDLLPVIRELDYAISDRMGDGLVRTTTLAEGAGRCDFRYRWRGFAPECREVREAVAEEALVVPDGPSLGAIRHQVTAMPSAKLLDSRHRLYETQRNR